MTKRLFSLLLSLFFSIAPASALFNGGGGGDDCVVLPIVMYHHISPKSRLWGRYVISPEQFEKDLRHLKENGFESITTSELLDWYDGGDNLPEKPVMITFDDGYESTFVYALPLLEQYGMTAVVSVIGAVAQQYTDLPDHMLDYSHMSWEAISEAAAGSVLEVQCHTYNMHKLSPRKGCGKKRGEDLDSYREILSADLERFQGDFSLHTGRTSTALALPFGSHSRDTLNIAREMGFRIVFTCAEKINMISGSDGDLLVLGRFNRPHGPSSQAFFDRWGMQRESDVSLACE